MQKLIYILLAIVVSASCQGNAKFNNDDLSAILEANEQGIIYLWSPFMPLSVLGREEVIEVAQTLKLNLVLLVDPLALETHTDDPLMQSSMLMKHGMLDHYPAIALYSKNKLIEGIVIHGYEPKKTLIKLIHSYLEKEN